MCRRHRMSGLESTASLSSAASYSSADPDKATQGPFVHCSVSMLLIKPGDGVNATQQRNWHTGTGQAASAQLEAGHHTTWNASHAHLDGQYIIIICHALLPCSYGIITALLGLYRHTRKKPPPDTPASSDPAAPISGRALSQGI